ncbi:hypothetical protein J5Y09_11440 [Roseomonas sp. PWR1]|uniref:Adhesin n=1 Tax=Roseomonas nitratireducens TaxID=2820810 RepID=A0ABS4AT44_9PROT|nr:hypothetical protein [Neoroseomonas nitratireducens]MBP0464520.1 hypothetical protein [Neoroseomonas nitratireducens]
MFGLSRRLLAAALFFGGLLVAGAPVADAQQPQLRSLIFRNNCGTQVRLLVRHAEDTRYYTTTGFYTIRPNTSTRLTERGDNIMHMTGYPLFFFAESGNGRTWSSPEVTVAHNGINYRMVRANQTVSGDSILFGVGC